MLELEKYAFVIFYFVNAYIQSLAPHTALMYVEIPKPPYTRGSTILSALTSNLGIFDISKPVFHAPYRSLW
jgi:hypothetical protein